MFTYYRLECRLPEDRVRDIKEVAGRADSYNELARALGKLQNDNHIQKDAAYFIVTNQIWHHTLERPPY